MFFKYLNYVLKHSVFVFIFSSRNILSIFSSRLSFFSFVFKALKHFRLGWKKFSDADEHKVWVKVRERKMVRWVGQYFWENGAVALSIENFTRIFLSFFLLSQGDFVEFYFDKYENLS